MEALFRRLGLSKEEMEIFLKLLKLGPQPISVLAKQVGIPRTSMYLVLERLRHSQLIEEFERKAITYVRAIPVKSISDVISNKQKQLQQTMTLLEENMAALEALEHTASVLPKVRFFDGKEEVMRMYALILREPEFCAFVDLESVRRYMPEYHELIPQMLRKHKGRARELAVESPEARRYKTLYESRRHRIGLLPTSLHFTSDIIICSDHIYMTAYEEERVSALQITSTALAHTKQVVFEKLWSLYGEKKRKGKKGKKGKRETEYRNNGISGKKKNKGQEERKDEKEKM